MTKQEPLSNVSQDRKTFPRREFIAGAGAATVALSAMGSEILHGADAKGKIRIGIIGAGGRGSFIAKLMAKHGGYEIAAVADYFQDRVDAMGATYKIDASRRYTGLSAYKKMLDGGGLDAVAVTSPPFFHPEHAAAAVDAGLHVYVAKPIAVDVPGCQSIAESGKKATAKKLCFLVDFQTRANPFYREAIKRVHYGAIGRVFSGEATYHSGRLKKKMELGTPEARLRNWVFDKALSGDIITEQNIHALDVASWIIDEEPLAAWGGGAQSVRKDSGDCWDNFGAVFKYPGNVTLNFNSKQCGQGHGGIVCRMYGATGTIHTKYGGDVNILGDDPYKGGNTGSIYSSGAAENIKNFHEQVLKGRPSNTTVAPSVRSTLTTILGRIACYTGKETTWKDIMRAGERMDGKLKGLKE